MKKWPADNKPVDIDEIIEPLKKALLQGYKLKRVRHNTDIKYEGLDIGESIKHVAHNPKHELSKEGLSHNKEVGRDLLDVVLTIAIQLGMEQGKRIIAQNIDDLIRINKSTISGIEKALKF